MSLDDEMRARLADLDRRGLLRRERPISGRGARSIRDGIECVCISSNNYLGLADHPGIARRVATASVGGVGSGASRLITGTDDLHLAAEAQLADFVGAEAAALFSSGYAANVGTLSSLMEAGDAIFSDTLNHASIIDGCRLSKAAVYTYPHGNTDELAKLLSEKRPGHNRALVVTDALFSMDGDVADICRLRDIADAHDTWLMVDEAHALGVLGPAGRGLCAREGRAADVLVGTLGKAFGAAGAFVCGSEALVEWLRNRARSYVFSTAPALPVVAGVLAAVDLVRHADEARRTLQKHAHRLREGLRAQGHNVVGQEHIVPVIVGDASAAMGMAAGLLAKGVLAQAIRPPTVPEGTSRIRLAPMATHTDADIEQVLSAFGTATR